MAETNDPQAQASPLLLGANGRLGWMLRHEARRAHREWQYQARTDEQVDLIWTGQSDDPRLREYLGQAQRPYTVLNMIGLVPVSGVSLDDMRQVNVDLVTTLLNIARDSGVAHVVLASSAAVYPSSGDDTPLSEDLPLAPQGDYGRSKAEMEDAVHAWAAQHAGPAISILRIGNVAGADSLLAAAEARAGKASLDIDLFDDGTTPVRSYIGPTDFFRVTDAICQRIPDTPIQTLNVAMPKPVSLGELAEAYRKYLLPNLEIGRRPAPEGTRQSVVLDTGRLSRIIPLADQGEIGFELATQVDRHRKSAQGNPFRA